jgi:demethylmenaquinone methyltransferase/2-methoxy-6-polyprenyl-1,4-benzoquinol methylase
MSAESVAADSLATRRFYDRISRAYDLIADASEHAIRDRALSRLALAPGERVLEVGFGTGHGLIAMTASVGASGSVYGIDISGGMVSVARRRLAWQRQQRRPSLLQADARALCFRSGAFDAVFFSFTLELFGTAIPFVLREAHRVVREGGRIGVVGLAESDNPSPISDVYMWLHRHLPHLIDCEPTDIARAIANAGFEVASVETTTMWTLPVAVVVGTKPVTKDGSGLRRGAGLVRHRGVR